MADSKVNVDNPRTVHMGGVVFRELQANSWDDLLRIYRKSFSPKPKSFRDKGVHPKQWVFRAEKRKTASKARDYRLCILCCDARASACQDSIAFVTSVEKAFRAFGIKNVEEKRKWEKDLVKSSNVKPTILKPASPMPKMTSNGWP